MKFVAIDVETANPDCSSICQVGIAVFENASIKETWCSLVNPEDYFDPTNISRSGISEEDVADAPLFGDVFPVIRHYISEKTAVHHMPFDKVAISRAATKYDLPSLGVNWLDSALVARRAWQEFRYRGYGLSNIATHLGITFQHHNALEDAIVAGKIVIRAIEETGIPLNDWPIRLDKPLTAGKIRLEGNPNGPLYGESLVFTGTLSRPRRQAAEIAANAGCAVSNSVNRQTTVLVVGTQDIKRLKGKDKSAKQLKTEELIRHGADIKIISEDDLLAMVGL